MLFRGLCHASHNELHDLHPGPAVLTYADPGVLCASCSAWCYEAELIKCHQTLAAAPAKHSGNSHAAAAPCLQLQLQQDQQQHDQQQLLSNSAEAAGLAQLQQRSSFESCPAQQQRQMLLLHLQQQLAHLQEQQHQQHDAGSSSQAASFHSHSCRLIASGSSSMAACYPGQLQQQQQLSHQASWNGLLLAGSCQKLPAHWQQPKSEFQHRQCIFATLPNLCLQRCKIVLQHTCWQVSHCGHQQLQQTSTYARLCLSLT
jgi:hypothetical protein